MFESAGAAFNFSNGCVQRNPSNLLRKHHYILLGGCLLAFGAAITNVAFLLQTRASVSHLSGDIARLATDISRSRYEVHADVLNVGVAALGFLCGAISSGFLIHHPMLEISRPLRTDNHLHRLVAADFPFPALVPRLARNRRCRSGMRHPELDRVPVSRIGVAHNASHRTNH